MKTAKLLLFVFIAVGLSLGSCKKKDDENADPSLSGGSLSARIDGADWNASLAVQAVNSNGVLSVTGSDASSKQLQITVINPTGAGEYQLGGNMTNQNSGRWTAGVNTNQTYTTTVGLGSGTVNISELTDTNVKGTFSFTAANSDEEQVSVTDGTFSAAFN